MAGFLVAYLFTVTNMRSGVEHDKAHQAEMPPVRVVQNFDRMAFDEYNPKAAVLQYMAPDAIDHDVRIKGDRESVVAFLDRIDWSATENRPKREVKLILNQGEFVAVFHHITRVPGTPGESAVDLFKVEGGFIKEHWSILEDMPEETPNASPMFQDFPTIHLKK